MPGKASSLRLDKWLWAARFFKTRSIASHACDLGRIQVNGQPAKPSREIRVGDRLRIKTPTTELELDVLVLSQIRGPAAVAQTLYRETEESLKIRQKVAEDRKLMSQLEAPPEGRPSKRDRRQINKVRGRY